MAFDTETRNEIHVQCAGNAGDHRHRIAALRSLFQHHVHVVVTEPGGAARRAHRSGSGMGNEFGRQLCLRDSLFHGAESVDGVRPHRTQMLTWDGVGRGIGPFVGVKFWETKFFHCSDQANQNTRPFQFRVILDASAKLPQTC